MGNFGLSMTGNAEYSKHHGGRMRRIRCFRLGAFRDYEDGRQYYAAAEEDAERSRRVAEYAAMVARGEQIRFVGA